jgi:hypothetical protein
LQGKAEESACLPCASGESKGKEGVFDRWKRRKYRSLNHLSQLRRNYSDQEEGEVHVTNYASAADQFPTFTPAGDFLGPIHRIVVQTAMPAQSKESKRGYFGLSSSRFSLKKRDEQADPVVSRMHEVEYDRNSAS